MELCPKPGIYDEFRRGDEGKLVHYLETKFKVDVIQDDEGTWGVEIMDDDGGGYRFTWGKADSANATKKEVYGSKTRH